MPAQPRDTYLGLSVEKWDKVELAAMGVFIATQLRNVLDSVGSKGLFGYGKSKRVVRASRMGFKKGTWDDINTLSIVLGFAILLKSGVDLLEAKTDVLKREISPGRGLFYQQYSRR